MATRVEIGNNFLPEERQEAIQPPTVAAIQFSTSSCQGAMGALGWYFKKCDRTLACSQHCFAASKSLFILLDFAFTLLLPQMMGRAADSLLLSMQECSARRTEHLHSAVGHGDIINVMFFTPDMCFSNFGGTKNGTSTLEYTCLELILDVLVIHRALLCSPVCEEGVFKTKIYPILAAL